ncbi:integrase repeat-containing protein [Flavobacterium gilvum]|uniref:Uncharacterized protein n=1 Tax=Flavobacterium gilvum TaxID=1492737 RepID=A0AAC9I9F7_9FLAO|nr:integrase repeat-containing protein [Flavobacterium gilvum]AOW11012.1 hypothetical protein EM308_16810 [Flavobacterium gilvum]KFC59193.1 hypothetical protein FEM08_20540 [Flavobacterium gilvum]
MSIKNKSLFKDVTASQYLNLLYKKSIIASYRTKPLRRDLFANYSLDFKSFINHLNSNQNYISIIKVIEDLSNKNTPDFELFYLKNGSYYSHNEIGLAFLRQKSRSSLENLKITSETSFKILVDKYNEAILDNHVDIEQLNWDFLLIFKTFFGTIELSELIELYLDILLDEKEYDGCEIIETILFDENLAPNHYFLQKNPFIFEKIIKCWCFTDKKTLSKSVFDKMFQYIDENFEMMKDAFEFHNLTPEQQIVYSNKIKNNIKKEDRDSYFETLTNIPKTWSFVNLTQINNVFRLNLIDENYYKKRIVKLEDNKKITDNYENEIESFNFLVLNADADIPKQIDDNEYFHYHNVYDFYELNSSQKAEYKTAFNGKSNLHKVKKYVSFRIVRINDAYYKDEITSDSAINELHFLSQFTSIYENNHVENIKAFESVKKSNLSEKINKCIYAISEYTRCFNNGICVYHNEYYYRFYISLEYSDAIKLPEEVLDIIIQGGNISNEEWNKWSQIGSNITYEANKLIERSYSELRSAKIEKELLLQLIKNTDNDCSVFMSMFHEKAASNTRCRFIGSVISKLISAYMKIKDFEKAIYWSDIFIDTISKYPFVYPTCKPEEIHSKREECIGKLKLITEKNKPKQSVFLSFEEAKIFVKTLNLKSEKEWREFRKSGLKPENIPSSPEKVYKNAGWNGFADWLGYNLSIIGSDFLSFEDAKNFVKTLNLKSVSEWKELKKSGLKPENIPASPENVYKNEGWNGFEDWLGYEKVSRSVLIDCLDFEDAKLFVHQLNINSFREWRAYCKSGDKPNNIPSNPKEVYKNKGWNGFADWLGYKTV